MKFLLVSIALVFALAVYQVEARNLGMKARFNTWKARFGKKNEDAATEEKRLAIFEKIANLIDEHNEKFTKGEVLFSMDLNPYSAAFEHEKPAKGAKHPNHRNHTKAHKRSIDQQTIQEAHGGTFHRYHYNSAVKTSASRDWRTVWNKPALMQGSCGSCWAFASTAVVEAALKIKKGLSVDLSEQELVDCAGGYDNNACDGGWPAYALEFVEKYGLNTEQEYPYTETADECQGTVSTTKIDSFVEVDTGNDKALMQAIDELGPCAIAIDVGGSGQTGSSEIYPEFLNYKNGIYTGRCSSSQDELDHAVTVVGYGTSTTGIPYWIVRNSWDTTWGDKGHMYLDRRTVNKCGISNFAVCAIVNK